MKKNSISYIVLLVAAISLFASCKKFEVASVPMTPINVGSTDTYASLNENSILTIPIKFTSLNDSGIASANYRVVNNRASDIILMQSPTIPLPFYGKTIDTTINIPVRKGLLSVVIVIYDKAGRMSSKSINIKSVVPSDENVKVLTNLVMSTDPADNQNFFSVYESTPVFGRSTALTKQNRIDMVTILNGGIRPITPHAYGTSIDYYTGTPANLNAGSKSVLAGFTTLTYGFVSTIRTYLTKSVFDALAKESDLNKLIDSTVVAVPPRGNNYNVFNLDRRSADAFTETSAVNICFIIGWGYHAAPPAVTALGESFALVLVKSVIKKANGHYVMTFDVKAPAKDQRADYNITSIAPYAPYPL
ncbi:MAG: hypothetical protein ABIN01_25815 [Ferruginibacter sp.]